MNNYLQLLNKTFNSKECIESSYKNSFCVPIPGVRVELGCNVLEKERTHTISLLYYGQSPPSPNKTIATRRCSFNNNCECLTDRGVYLSFDKNYLKTWNHVRASSQLSADLWCPQAIEQIYNKTLGWLG